MPLPPFPEAVSDLIDAKEPWTVTPPLFPSAIVDWIDAELPTTLTPVPPVLPCAVTDLIEARSPMTRMPSPFPEAIADCILADFPRWLTRRNSATRRYSAGEVAAALRPLHLGVQSRRTLWELDGAGGDVLVADWIRSPDAEFYSPGCARRRDPQGDGGSTRSC
jgi:hypothetical protein